MQIDKYAYGLSSREVAFVNEFLKETGETDELLLPVIISNIKEFMSRLDTLYSKEYTLNDLKRDYGFLPNDLKNEARDNYLLASLEMYGLTV